ncbi:2-oxoglutarate dehydrogenase complex dihydrolipoyllysine-residue succinyltransferase [Calditrichota bacterium LG25]
MRIEIKAPEVGESINEVTIGKWLKKDGDFVEQDEIICEVESEKATLEVVSENNGQIKILVKEGETVPIGTSIATIETDAARPQKDSQVSDGSVGEKTVDTATKTAEEHKLKITPVARKIIQEKKIDEKLLARFSADERITKARLEELLKDQQNDVLAAQAAEFKEDEERPKSAQPSGIGRKERRERMSTLRQTIARHLVQAKQSTAMLTTFNEVDMSEIIKLRREYKEEFLQRKGVKLGFMSFFIKAVAQALQELPVVNARIDGEDLVYHEYVDIGIAVSTDRGLVVPVIRDVQNMSLAEIEREVARLATAARDKKLSIEELKGGTFSITNGGVFGSLLSTPIINIPQTAILGMHNIQERPVAIEGQVVIRPMMYLALSYDHRVIDGKESVQFLVRVKELIERPIRLLLDV